MFKIQQLQLRRLRVLYVVYGSFVVLSCFMKFGSEGGPKEGHKRRIGVPGFGLPAWRPQRQEKLQGFKLHSEFTLKTYLDVKVILKSF